jgi:hypothetical protein
MPASLLEILRSIPDHRRAEGKRVRFGDGVALLDLGNGSRRQLLPANA